MGLVLVKKENQNMLNIYFSLFHLSYFCLLFLSACATILCGE